MNPSARIVFMGTPAFALTTLQKLYEAKYPIMGVFSQPDKPVGRGQKPGTPPVAQWTSQQGLPLFQPIGLKDPSVVAGLAALKPDLIIVVAYGLFLPKTVLSIPTIDVLNLHGSLLPQYRGAAPIQWALINGDTETGITLMRITPQMDAGPMYAKAHLPIDSTDTAGTLSPKLAGLGADLLLEKLPLIISGTISPTLQDGTQASLAPRLQKSDGCINWGDKNTMIHNRIRGLDPWPGSYTFIDKQLLKIYDSSPSTERQGAQPGIVLKINEAGCHVACGEGVLCIKEVQLEGKKRLHALDFAKGYRSLVGLKFLQQPN